MVEVKQGKVFYAHHNDDSMSYSSQRQSTDLSDDDNLEGSFCTNQHEGRQLVNEVYPFHVDQLFTFIFTDSNFYSDFYTSRKTISMTQSEWMHNEETGTDVRKISLTVPLNYPMGPKTAKVNETQTLLSCSKAGHLFAIDVEIVNSEVPYADSFYFAVHYCLERISDTQSSMSIFAQIKYKKSVWGFVKGFIEKNGWQGMEETYTSLSNALHAEAEEIQNLTKRKYRRRKSHKSHPGKVKSRKDKLKPAAQIVTIDYPIIVVFIVFIILIILNMLLYYKLLSLEEYSPFTSLNEPSYAEWVKMLHSKGMLDRHETIQWYSVLKRTIQLLHDMELSMSQLKQTIPT